MNAQPIDHDTLIAYAAGELGPEEARRVEAFLEQTPDARTTVRRFREISRQLAEEARDEPPAKLIARAKAIFAVNTATPFKKWLEKVDSLVASIVFDSRLQPLAVRDDRDGSSFQLAFESDEADVDLQVRRVEPDPGGAACWSIMGQVAADRDLGPRRVLLLASGSREPRGETMTDERGLFELRAERGAYDLAIELPDAELLLPDIRMD